MMPKVIHYCWFGRNPLPESATKSINSWKKFLPNYEIKEWNEDNFDVNIINYTKEAYEAKKYAFVSDYARFWILYKYGGLYFDTDVEVIKVMDDIIEKGPFMGIETPAIDGTFPSVNPGLGLGVNPGNSLYKELIDHYQDLHFLDKDGKPSAVTIVSHTTDILLKKGLMPNNNVQCVEGVWIYPKDFFNPLEYATGKLLKTNNTRSIHWYAKSWISPSIKYRSYITRIFHRLFGNDCFACYYRLMK